MGAGLPSTMRPVRAVRGAEQPVAEPGVWDTIAAGFEAGRGDTLGYENVAEIEAARPYIDALADLGYDPADFNTQIGRRQAMFRAIRAEKAKGRMTDAPDSWEQFDEAWRTRTGRRLDRAADTAARGIVLAAFAGGVAAGMTDPATILTMPFGGFGGSILRRVATEAVIGAGVELAQTPFTQAQRTALNRDQMTGDEIAANVLVGGVAAGTLRGAFEIAPKALAGARGAFERSVAAHWEKLPQGLRERWTSDLPGVDTPEYDLLTADTAEAIVGGRDSMAQHEIAAADVVRREAGIALASPLARNGAGAELHPALLADAMRRVLAQVPESYRATPSVLERGAAPQTGAVARPADFASSTAISSGTAPAGAQAGFMARVRRQESGGSDTARNPRSSAMGRYQFTDGTWLSYFKRRFGAGLSDAAILAKKRDGVLQDTLMRDLTADNTAFLNRQGEAVSEGNLYLVHFAGQGGAKKLFDADPGASAAAVLGQAVVNANPHLRGMTAQGVIDWAHRAMGAKPGVRAGARAVVADDVPQADALQVEIDRIQGELDSLGAAREAAPDTLADGIGDAVPPVSSIVPPIDDPALSMREVERAASEAVEAALDPLRAIVAGRELSLNKPRQLAEALGVAQRDAAAALERLAELGEITINRKTGKFMRKAAAPDTIANRPRPRTLLEYLSERGGLNDHGGDLRSMGLRTSDRRFGKRVIRSTERPNALAIGSDEGDFGFDTAFLDAVSAGYFPEHYVSAIVNNEKLDGAALLLDAIDKELAGNPRFAEGDFDRLREFGLRGATEELFGGTGESATARTDMEPDELDYWRGVAGETLRDIGFEEDFSPEIMDELVDAMLATPEGLNGQDALFLALNDMMERNQAEAFAYGDEAAYEAMDYGQDATLEAGYAAAREAGAAAADRGGWEPADPYAAAGGFRGEGDGRADEGAALAELPPEARAPFLDPDNQAIKAQAESLEHDARAAVDSLDLPDITDPAIAERLAQEIALRAEAPMRATSEQDGTMGLPMFDAADQPMFRLDAEGDEIALPDLLADLDAEAADLKTIRDCM